MIRSFVAHLRSWTFFDSSDDNVLFVAPTRAAGYANNVFRRLSCEHGKTEKNNAQSHRVVAPHHPSWLQCSNRIQKRNFSTSRERGTFEECNLAAQATSGVVVVVSARSRRAVYERSSEPRRIEREKEREKQQQSYLGRNGPRLIDDDDGVDVSSAGTPDADAEAVDDAPAAFCSARRVRRNVSSSSSSALRSSSSVTRSSTESLTNSRTAFYRRRNAQK